MLLSSSYYVVAMYNKLVFILEKPVVLMLAVQSIFLRYKAWNSHPRRDDQRIRRCPTFALNTCHDHPHTDQSMSVCADWQQKVHSRNEFSQQGMSGKDDFVIILGSISIPTICSSELVYNGSRLLIPTSCGCKYFLRLYQWLWLDVSSQIHLNHCDCIWKLEN